MSSKEMLVQFMALVPVHCAFAALPLHFGGLLGGYLSCQAFLFGNLFIWVWKKWYSATHLYEFFLVDQPIATLGPLGMVSVALYPSLISLIGEVPAGLFNSLFFSGMLEATFKAQRKVADKTKHAGDRFRVLSMTYAAISGMLESFSLASVLNATITYPDRYLWIIPVCAMAAYHIIGRLGWWSWLLDRKRPPTIDEVLRRDGKYYSGYTKFVGPAALMMARLCFSPSTQVPWYLNSNFVTCTFVCLGEAILQDMIVYRAQKAGLEAKYSEEQLQCQEWKPPFAPAYTLDDFGKQVRTFKYVEVPLMTGAWLNVYYAHYTACMCVVGLLMTSSVNYMLGLDDSPKHDLTDGTVLWALPDSFWRT
jgi:hypothetical protein